ncbi:MAG: choice-of-anchor M domain-containing protein [Pirellula sp.]
MSRPSTLLFLFFVVFSALPLRGDIWIGGHGDIAVGLTNNQLDLHLHFEANATGASGTIAAGEYEPGDHVIGVPSPSVSRPTGAQWNFLGSAANIWFLPQSVDNTKPFLGFGTEELNQANWTGLLTWSLNSVVSAPVGSNFSVWGSDQFGNPIVRMATSDGISAADSFTQAAGGHEHFNLGFTDVGTYQISLRIAGVHNTLGALSDSATFTFQVGNVSAVPEPSSLCLLFGTIATGVFIRARICRKP